MKKMGFYTYLNNAVVDKRYFIVCCVLNIFYINGYDPFNRSI